MLVTVATSSPFLFSFLKPHSGEHGNENGSVDVRRIKRKYVITSCQIQVKASSQSPIEVNGSRKHVMNDLKADNNRTSHAPKTAINQLQDWMLLEWKAKQPDLDLFGFGRTFQDGLLFCQNFPIRSYEIGADRSASIQTIMNYLQDTGVNHAKSIGLIGEGFGTPYMCKKNLFWALTKMQVIVDRYPTWCDVVQVSTWMARNGKNSIRRDWLLHDSQTSQILARASSNYVMMNKETRRLSRIPDEVRREIEVYFVDAPPVIDDDCRKLPKLEETTADYVLNGLSPSSSDLDVNQHVNNVKYIHWILESIPQVVEKYELASITLEYRRECRKDCVLKSLTSVLGDCGAGGDNGGITYSNNIDCQHVLLFEGGSDGIPGGEIVKGKTEWRLK